MIKLGLVLFFSFLFSYACAYTSPRRGSVVVTGRVVRAVVTGPAEFHGYSEFPGGVIFVAQSTKDTDAACAAAFGTSGVAHSTTLVAGQVAKVQLEAGQVACLVTDTDRPFELLWHSVAYEAPAEMMATK